MIDLKHCASVVLLLLASAVCWAQKPELVVQTGHAAGVNSIAFSPDGKLIASGSSDKTIKLWDVATGRQLRSLEGHEGPVMSVAFSPNGKLIGSSSHDIRWDVATGKQLRSLPGAWFVFSPDGKVIASRYEDKTIKLWDTSNGNQLCALEGHAV